MPKYDGTWLHRWIVTTSADRGYFTRKLFDKEVDAWAEYKEMQSIHPDVISEFSEVVIFIPRKEEEAQ